MKVKPNIIATNDGSSTIFSEATGDHYHSLNGAETESNYVFIEMGLKNARKKFDAINILEVGMGTGLNLCLTYNHYILLDFKSVNYVALEPFPIDIEVADELKFEFLNKDRSKELFHYLHRAKWNEKNQYDSGFSFEKVKEPLQTFESDQLFDLIYYDAFGPGFQPEMWNIEIISKICSLMSKDGMLVSYCAQGQFRRNLEACGLKIEKLPGPPGKREMIRARN